ncbi:MAG TPA: 50S ribosomal protein L29 [Planctomycetota bacterium]|jgi:large subunit ribosomal protein L29|nr:50S ribosomal protein L29 [Planctomycetota bacterium]
MNITEIRALDEGDLQVQLDKHRRDLFNLRVKATTENLENPRQIGHLRRSIARLLTEQRRRQIAEGGKA